MKKVVVIGGGFAGSEVAKKLESKFEVTLIDTKNYFEFTPSVLRTFVEPNHVRKIQVLHCNYLLNAKIVIGKVTGVDDNRAYVGKKSFGYDYLVICAGSRYELPFKGQDVVAASRASYLVNVYEDLKRGKRVVLVGGGLVGVELAAEIVGKYGREKEVVIVHSGKQLIERNNIRAIEYAQRFLENRGVKILFGERVEDIRKKVCYLSSGRKIKFDVVFLCTGIKPNCEFLNKLWLEERGVAVDEFLRVRGKKNVFAAGDVNSITEEKTAQAAEKQASVVVRNIIATENNQRL